MSTDALTATVKVAIPARLVETFDEFREAAADPALGSAFDEVRKPAVRHYAMAYSRFAEECLSRGLNETTVRTLLGENHWPKPY